MMNEGVQGSENIMSAVDSGESKRFSSEDISNSSVKIIDVGDMGEVYLGLVNEEKKIELAAVIADPKPFLFNQKLTYLVTVDYKEAPWEALLSHKIGERELRGVTDDERLAVLAKMTFYGKIMNDDVGAVIRPGENVDTVLKLWRENSAR